MASDLTRADLAALRCQLSGCMDHSCQVHPPDGQGTNGGCRCFPGVRGPNRRGVLTLARDSRRLLDLVEEFAWSIDRYTARSVAITPEFEDDCRRMVRNAELAREIMGMERRG